MDGKRYRLVRTWRVIDEAKGSMSKTLRITLKKSLIGRPEKHRRVVRSLGLGKLNSTVFLQDTPAMRGMVQKVCHLLEVEEEGQ